MISPARAKLLEILRETRVLLARPDNDFSWSSWEDGPDATGAIDRFIVELENDKPVSMATLGVFFAPTGPIQETSLSSGWGDAYLALADRFDEVVATGAG